MRDVGPDIIIVMGALVCIAYGSLVIATRTAINDDLQSLLGMPDKMANQQKQSVVQDPPSAQLHSVGSDVQNYVTYSHNGAIASIVVGVLQIVVLIFKHSIRPTYYLGGRR
jgi:hypothetical protein